MGRRPNEATTRGGFALVLALAAMALLILALLSLSGLLMAESRGAEAAQQSTRARLNAVMSGRLALAHLQQEAGPDRRATATGELAGVPAILTNPLPLGTPAAQRVGQGQRRWTGVWRSDRPDQPPAWLVSGKGNVDAGVATTHYLAQSESLAGLADYTAAQWAPWQADYPVNLGGEPMTLLVGNGTAGVDPGPDGTVGTADDIDHRVALPRVPFPGAGLGEVAGGFSYWVGDEGVKVRVNLDEPRDLASAAPGNLASADALRAPGRAGTALLLGLGGLDAAGVAEGLRVADRGSVALLAGYQPADPSLRLPTRQATFHDHTFWSAGVLADSYRGGLRRDLSLAFEMDDREFDVSEYGDATGEGSGRGAATEIHTTFTPVDGGPALRDRTSWFPSFPAGADGTITSPDPRPRVWVPIWEGNPDNPGRDLTTTGSAYKAWAPVFLREDEMGQAPRDPLSLPDFNLEPPFNRPRRLVGPLWHLVRDYYRLYKEVDWVSGAPRLDARAFYPNIDHYVRGGYRPDPALEPFSRYDLDNAHWSNGGVYPGDRQDADGDTPDPLGVPNGTKAHRFQPRAVRGAYMPALHRLALVVSVKRVADGADCRLRLFCTPVVALHNPYNAALRLRAPVDSASGLAAKGAGRVSFSGLNELKVLLRTHVGNDPLNPEMETRGARLDHVLGLRSGTTRSDDANLGASLPEMTLAPGEMVVLTSREAVAREDLPGAAGDALRLAPGLFITGGIHADLVTHALSVAGNPNHATTPSRPRFLAPGRDPSRPGGDFVEAWIDGRGMRWRHWVHLCSFRRQSRTGDITADLPPSLHEALGAGRQGSRASHALMVNLGDLDADAGILLGDPGSAGAPVRVGPMAALRDIRETGAPPSVIGVVDTRARVSDTARRTSFDRGRLGWPDAWANPVPAPHPSWMFTNPLAQTSASPGHRFVRAGGGPAGTMSTSMGSPHVVTQLLGGDQLGLEGASLSWSGLIEVDAGSPDGRRAFGGASHGSGGSPEVIQVEVPFAPALSIGQLMHANLSAWPWFPYHTVGNSFPCLAVPRDKSWVHGIDPSPYLRRGGHTMPDMAYLMNHALWDSFYFSGAAPRLSASRDGAYASVRAKTTQEVLDGFAAGDDTLANPRLRLHRPAGQPSPGSVFAATGFHQPSSAGRAPDGHRRLAGFLLNDGAFNVNSTSVEAWTGLLGSVRAIGLGADAAGSDGYRFPRVIGTPGQQAAARSLTSSTYWSGFAKLTEAQLRALAQGIVDEVRARARFHQRTERDQEYPPATPPGASGPRRFRGFPAALEPGTPFLGLTEFVNRYLGPTKQAGAHVARSLYPIRADAAEAPSPALPASARKYFWTFGSGTLESAIGRADKALGANAIAAAPTGAATIVASVSHNWNHATPGLPSGGPGSRTGMPIGYFLRNVQVPAPDATDTDTSAAANRSHNGMGAPGCLFQGDLLQALGPALASRSDTFVIRAAGDGATLAEAGQRPTTAVLELVVQRVPDFMDPRNAPETRLTDPVLLPVNRALGRRFKVVSARWLAPDQI